jgi:hypothetical protein
VGDEELGDSESHVAYGDDGDRLLCHLGWDLVSDKAMEISCFES